MSERRAELRLAGALLVTWVGFGLPEHVTVREPDWTLAPLELFFLAVLALLLPRRRALHLGLTLGSVGWVFVVTAHRVIERIYERPPAVVEDWRLALNLLHFVGAASSPTVWGPALGGVLVFACFGVSVFEVQAGLAAVATRRLLALWLFGLALAWHVDLGQHEPHRWLDKDVRPVSFGLHALERNWRQSKVFLWDMRDADEREVDRRYEQLLRRKLSRRPNVYLLMIEAYGEVLYRPPFDEFSRALGQRLDAALAQRGLSMRTAFSEAPIHGGGSWLSMATLQIGLRIDRPSRFAVLERVGSRVPGLTRWFESQGYATSGVFPGNTIRRGLGTLDIYGRQFVLDGIDMEFKGHVQPWGAAPDQYAWGFFVEKYLKGAPSPRFVTSMSVSTHWDWWYQAPYVADWRTLGDTDDANDVPVPPPWEALPLPAGPGIYEPRYARAVEYEWRVLLDVFDADRSEDALFLIVGDHQPYLGPDTKKDSFRTPVHVVTRHQPTLEAFEAAGFRSGYFVAPADQTTLWHEGFLSLVISRLAMADGQADAAQEFWPQGIHVSGLRAVAPR